MPKGFRFARRPQPNHEMKEPLLTTSERKQIAEILDRRSREVASFRSDLNEKAGTKFHELPGSVELALSREVERLRYLRDKVNPPTPEEE